MASKRGRKEGALVVGPEPQLEELNHTELVMLCLDKGLPGASRDIPADVLIKVLRGELPEDHLGDPIDRRRDAIAKFLEDNPTVKPQLRCDLDHARCPPARVLHCFLSSDLIREYLE